jgi:hypothetical protein
MPRLPTDSPEDSLTGPSGPELIYLDKINGSEDSEYTTPLVGSPTGIAMQLGEVEVSVETSALDPLREIIKIYDDDESSEVSLNNPVHVEEEKGPVKTYYPIFDVQTQEVPQKEKETESFPDTKFSDTLDTQADSPRDEPKSGEPEERTPQQEFNISMTDEQVSIASIPETSISISSQTCDE